GEYFAVSYLNWVRIYDLETYEIKSSIYENAAFFIFNDNRLFLYNGFQRCYDISRILNISQPNISLINIIPNPNNGTLTFNFNLQNSGNYEIKIINTAGQEVVNQNLGFLLLGNNSITKEFQLPNGTYYVTI